ncbi:autotransporter-associated beta strand repeat-containing protein [Novosphingobium ginsenosidimutans]|uniref:Autotransporter domain-containing protein n=1 Tax=Novosphingobium ginsenosidimutans TaxID=1176536 RepID=A0A5B8S279_9SPHN|nr:autotransporter outer membrane beta-barrel domain-containing protein [Novosphingobium ginsenosidimutans]QEA15626.1 hypothetical protein FRF71_05465 [Novosphingobium ginsenosidimutans]
MHHFTASKVRVLLHASVLATVAGLMAGRAEAQDYGIISDGPVSLGVSNPNGTTLQGNKSGVYARGGGVSVDNRGTIRGDGTYDGPDAPPDGGITIAQAGSYVFNYSSGLISGARFGITTAYYFNPETSQLEGRAIGTNVFNLGQIIGDTDDGVRLIGGGTVANNGLIEGRTGTNADGVSMFSFAGQNTSGQTGIGTVSNDFGATIRGNRFGVILSGGGTVYNYGSIIGPDFSSGTLTGFGGGVLIQAQVSEPGKIGTIINNGSITGGSGVSFGGALSSGIVENYGTITGTRLAGVDNSSSGVVTVNNFGTITGVRGVLAREGAITLNNSGEIFGQGSGGSTGAVVIEQAGSSIQNSGLIQGNMFGITANAYFNAATGQSEGRAIGTAVTNTGTIRGLNNDGIRLIGGGTVTNSGLIEGLNGSLADGISAFGHTGQDLTATTAIATVNNLAGGEIRGNRYGIILSNGGTVNNAGTIWGADYSSGNLNGLGGGVAIQDVNGGGVKIATVINGGTITGGVGVSFSGAMTAANLVNSGSVIGRVGDAVSSNSNTVVNITNEATGTITGARSGVFSEYSQLHLTNAGTIRGNGSNANFNRTDAGVVMIQPGSTVSNSGTISGAKFGITTTYLVESGVFSGLARDTSVVNSGTIRGDTNDGVRLVGGGSVTNSGLIEGLVDPLADGISIFAFDTQDISAITGIGSVTNQAGGTIRGSRFGIILSGGGSIENAGNIIGGDTNSANLNGLGGGILIQGQNGFPDKLASVNNAGSISGGNGVSFGGTMAAASLSNSGTITGTVGDAIAGNSSARITVNNLAGGNISGARSGIYGEFSPLSVNNAGTIRGNGTNGSFNRTDAGVIVVQPGSSVTNTGTISGRVFGITTSYLVDAATVDFLGLARGTAVTNSGTIRGDTNDGVRLMGGGTVTNSGLIEGLVGGGADGVSMFAFEDQDLTGVSQIGRVTNQSGGTIRGNRFGVILSGGGTVENDGLIRGNSGGILIQGATVPGSYAGTVINRGSIENGIFLNNDVVADVTNSGSISLDSATGAAIEALGQAMLLNTGTISNALGTAIRFGAANDTLTLGTGSQIVGTSDGGSGIDTLRLNSGTGVIQSLGRFDNFETLEVLAGTWNVSSNSGSFGTINISGGELGVTGAIAGNVTTSGGGTFRLGSGGTVGGFTGNIVNDGRLLIDIGSNFDVTGSFSGTGLFTKQGAGTVSFLGGYNFGGTTQLLGGSIRIAGAINPSTVFDLQSGTLDLSGSTTTTIAGLSGTSSSSLLLGGTANLTVNQTNNTVYAGSISGSGSLLKQGDGRLNLTGTNTYTGTTTVAGGTLAVNGSITSPVTVKSGATLGGTGTTGTVTIETGGIFAPGNSIGTINVKGTLRFQSGSRYLVEASAAGAADRINVTGDAVIGSGVSVQVLAANGNYKPSTSYMILTATNKITGTFASVSTDLAFLEPKLNQTSKYVELTLKRKSNTFASIAADPKQAAVATAIESMGLYNSLYDSVLTQNLAGARAAFDSFSGDFFGTISNRIVGSALGIKDQLAADALTAAQGPAVWNMVETGTRTSFSPRYRSGLSLARNGFSVAVMTGYVPYERLAAGGEGNASVATHYAGGTFGYNADGWSLGVGAGFARHEVQASRHIAFSDFADGSQSRYSTSTRQLFAEASYSFHAAGLSVTPFASATRMSISGNRIEEIGGDAALSIISANRTLNLANAGLRIAGTYDLGRGLRIAPKLAASWQWAGGDLGTWQQSQFKGNGTRFDIVAAPLAAKSVNVDAGLELSLGRMSLATEYRRSSVLQEVGDGGYVTFRFAF